MQRSIFRLCVTWCWSCYWVSRIPRSPETLPLFSFLWLTSGEPGNGMNIHGGSKSVLKQENLHYSGCYSFFTCENCVCKANNVPRRFGLLLCLSLLGRGRDCVGLWADYCSLGLGALTLTKWRCVLCPHFHSCPKNITIVQKFHSRGLKYIWHAKLRSATSLSCNFS